MDKDNRLECYQKLIEAYNCLSFMQYDRGIYVLQTIIDYIEEVYQQHYSHYFYSRRAIDYSRPIPKNSRSKQKKFIEWLHKAIFNISKDNYISSYSYIRDMKTILEELNDNNRTS